MPDTCKDCRYFAKDPFKPNGDGQCRYEPPKHYVMPTPQGIIEMGGWPPVSPTKWCRMFDRKPLEASS